ncbi:MAG: hypothetical protein OER90_04385 [Gemmatimonadota bacterium]|nr:hypothetical protein [Gemmatimonadota bacterium]
MLALLGTACEGEPETVVVSGDDAVIVENSLIPQERGVPWTIATAPELSIGLGEAEDAHHLFLVRDAVVLEGGRIAIANGGTGEIRIFEPDGAHVVSMGGAGEGPGEFRRLEAIARWAGDSILGWDGRQQRISVFDAAGQHGRTFRVPQFNDSFGAELLGVTPDARFFVRAGFPQRGDEPFRGMFRPDQMYALLTGTGEVAVDLGVHPGAEGFLSAGGDFESFYGHPHAKSTVATVWGERVLISPNDVFELRAFTLDGQPSMTVRLDYETARPTQEDMWRWFEDFTTDDTPEERAAFRRMFDEFPLLESFPAFAAIVVDEFDHVWVRELRTPGDQRAIWVVFDRNGVALGRVETPPGLEVYEIGADYILGLARDEFDVEGVQRWPLIRQ